MKCHSDIHRNNLYILLLRLHPGKYNSFFFFFFIARLSGWTRSQKSWPLTLTRSTPHVRHATLLKCLPPQPNPINGSWCGLVAYTKSPFGLSLPSPPALPPPLLVLPVELQEVAGEEQSASRIPSADDYHRSYHRCCVAHDSSCGHPSRTTQQNRRLGTRTRATPRAPETPPDCIREKRRRFDSEDDARFARLVIDMRLARPSRVHRSRAAPM